MRSGAIVMWPSRGPPHTRRMTAIAALAGLPGALLGALLGVLGFLVLLVILEAVGRI